MIRSDEWHFSLGPLDFDVGIRAIQLSEGYVEPGPVPAEADAPRALPPGTRPAGRAELDWESEGGSLG